MTMERVLEPELMDDAEQAEAYALADFAEANQAFVDRFVATFPELTSGRLVDFGCGPADICLRLAQRVPGLEIVGVDGSPAMLAEAERAIAAAGLGHRVQLQTVNLPDPVAGGPFQAAMSNSLLHHLHDPTVLWKTIAASTEAEAPILVVDLFRPESKAAASAIVETHAKNEAPVLKTDFYNSLLAAFTPDEIRAQLDAAGLGNLCVETISERHVAVSGVRV